MRIGQLNIRRGFCKKIDAIEKIICDNNFQVLGLSETDLDEHEALPMLRGYLCLASREKKRRVCAYIAEDYQIEELQYN